MKYEFSFIIPVYNRPQEIHELLESFTYVKGIQNSEILIVEDGSSLNCKNVIDLFKKKLNLSYYFKENSGPGDSRNYGMQKAKSNYFIILDSDVLLPETYIVHLKKYLKQQFVHCFGGPDKANQNFKPIQKAINYAMTSFWTTGGIRGGKAQKTNFQPRSFNMGLSKIAFEKSNGFSNIHPGEDPDLSLRLTDLGFKTALFSKCFVYHKRRISWSKFYKQIHKFGLVRPILIKWHPKSKTLIYYLPTIFSLGFVSALGLFLIGYSTLFILYCIYFIFVFIDATLQNKSIKIGLLALFAVNIQLLSYGYAFLKSTLSINLLKKDPTKHYPFLFFKPYR